MDEIDQDGFVVVPRVVGDNVADKLIDAVSTDSQRPDVRQRGGRIYAMRNLLEVPRVRELSRDPAVRRLVEPVLGPDAHAVRGILFDKTPAANWKVAWHQDLSIAVRQRLDAPGFGPWSSKAGIVHVQPPREILEGMLTVRLHLDDCGEGNGPLRVVAGSHAQGVLSPVDVAALARVGPVVTCTVPRGGAVVMRPLILHASSPAVSPARRRVVHLEFSGVVLPAGLEWAFSA